VSARGYLQGKDFVPHDARLETLIALGRKPVLVPDHKVEDGINAGHERFKRVWFDEARCAPGLEALRQHRVDYDEKTRAFKRTANPCKRSQWISGLASA
jgi:phage terminase large subunit